VTDAGPLLEPDLLSELARLQLRLGRPLVGAITGDHRSVRRGASLDFVDYREYRPGDDLRRVDQHHLARSDDVFLKQFDAEEDLTLRLLLDASASMAFGAKLDMGCRLAAALGYLALAHRDAVTLSVFPSDDRPRRFVGREAVPPLFDALQRVEASGETGFARAVNRRLAERGPRGAVVVISDLLTPEWEAALPRLRGAGTDVTLVHLLAHDDLHPQSVGDLELVDAETGGHLPVSLDPRRIERFELAAADWVRRVEDRCGWADIRYLRVMSDEEPRQVLLRSWRRAGWLL